MDVDFLLNYYSIDTEKFRMLNSINLHDSQDFYLVTHQGKQYQCTRVSKIVEHTSATPNALKVWMVNCAVEYLISNGLKRRDLNDPNQQEVIKTIKRSAWSAHQVKQQQALDIGTRAHHMIKNNAYDVANTCEESKACWKAFCAFRDQYLPVPIAQEISLYDTDNLVAGTMDWLGILTADLKNNKPGKRTLHILDWKSSKQLSHSYKIQIVIYKHMLLNVLKIFIKNPCIFDVDTTRILNDIILVAGKKPKIVCGLVRLNKNPNARKFYEFVELTAKEEKHCLKEFKLMIQLFNHRKENKEWSC